MDIDRYLARLSYSRPVHADAETLCGLQRAHMLAIPFENLDIVPLHRPVDLHQEALWEKIVVRGRGGFCYELNGLFGWLLEQVGFNVTYLNVRVFTRAGLLGPDFDHLALWVKIQGEDRSWLADVGFGDSFLEPLEMSDGEQPQGLRAYRLEHEPAGYTAWQQNYDGSWERLYFFDLQPHGFPDEYETACLYHQRSPDSHFTRSSIISRATETGRISLEPEKIIYTENGQRREEPIDPGDWKAKLREHFDIVL